MFRTSVDLKGEDLALAARNKEVHALKLTFRNLPSDSAV
jgi:hypothetical protein